MQIQGEVCFEIVQELLLKGADGEAYGDLFITDGRLVFSILSRVSLEKNQPLIAPSPVDTIARIGGELARSVGYVDPQDLREGRQTARAGASFSRERRRGLSMDARIQEGAIVAARTEAQALRRHPFTESVPAFEVPRPQSVWASLDPQPDPDIAMIEIVLGGRPPLAIVARNATPLMDRLQRWMVGQAVEVSSDWQGLEQSLPSETDLCEWIEQPARYPNITVDTSAVLAQKSSYCSKIVSHILSLPWPQRGEYCDVLKLRSAPLAAGVAAVLAKSSGGASEGGILLIFSTLLCFVGAIPLAGYQLWRWSALAVALGVGQVLIIRRLDANNRRRNQELAARLSG